MKFFTNKESSKKIIIAILMVMTFNFVTPTLSVADFGGALFNPIAQLLCGIADKIIEKLQDIFMGTPYIRDEGVPDLGHPSYYIKYSPGIIFSGEVAGLKTNFIDASEDDFEQIEYNYHKYETMDGSYSKPTDIPDYNSETSETYRIIQPLGEATFRSVVMVKWTKSDENYYAIAVGDGSGFMETVMTTPGLRFLGGIADGILAELNPSIDNFVQYTVTRLMPFEEQGEAFQDLYDTFKYYKEVPDKYYGEPKMSSAYILKETVATWFVALRSIALVGLLSVLVYVGIRILISSTGQEKAKYKRMITDWVAAICILFVLQYIMLFVSSIVENINDIINSNIIGDRGEDVLMSDIRSRVGDSMDFEYMFTDMLLYMVLVIFTLLFTIQYLKRLVYLAFFTLIAPLVALTYPIDKIKDGQAQAFSMWLREYIFYSLIQPVHLLIYYIFVGSAHYLRDSNPIYAIVAIGFLLPAEKFFRKMFGFEKASSIGQSGATAAAGGALVMNAINKMGQKRGKKASGNSENSGNSGSSSPRYASSPGGNPGGQNPGGQNPGGQNPGGQNPGGQNPGGQNPGGQNPGGQNPGGGNSTFAPPRNQTRNAVNYNGGRVIKGVGTVAGRFAAKGGKLLAKGAIGAAGAAALGTIGLATGIATGDASSAFKYGLAGAGAGFVGANSLASGTVGLAKGAVKGAKGIRDRFEESALGTVEHNTLSSIRELSRDNDFNEACNNLGIQSEEQKAALIRDFHSNGINTADDIKKAMDIRVQSGATMDEVIYARKLRQQIERNNMTPQDVKEKLRDNGVTDRNQINRALDIIDMW